MKISLQQLIPSEPYLTELNGSPREDKTVVRLPAHAAFRVGRIAKIVGKALTAFREQHLALLKELGTEVEGQPGMFQFTAENTPAFTENYEKLIAEEIDIPVTPLMLEDLGRADITGALLNQLDWLIVQPEE